MTMVPLTARLRPQDANVALLRKQDRVPCVLYGNAMKNTMIDCEYNELFKVYVKAGESTLVELDTGSGKVPVLFHDIDLDPVSDRIIHVDFYAVDMKKEIEARVPVHFVGEAPAVKELAAILVHTQDHVTVKCLPTNLPASLNVSLDSLIAFGDTVAVSNLVIPPNVVVMDAPEVVLAIVQEPRKEEEILPVVVEGAVPAEGEVTAEAAIGPEGEAATKKGEVAAKKGAAKEF